MRRLFFLLLFAAVFAPQAVYAAGEVKFLQGELWINEQPAKVGSFVKEGDTLRAGDGSRVDVIMDDGLRFRLYSRSELEIPRDSRESPWRLIVGKLLSIVKPGREYAVQGKTAVAGVRGTTFFMSTEPRRRSYVCLCAGKLHVEGRNGGNEATIQATHHKAVALDDETYSDEPMLYHTDGEIEELRSR